MDELLKTDKLYYTISEVANIFNVKPSLIRFWENEFDIIRPQRNKKGNRLFTKKDIENFYIIYHLIKEKGYTIQGAKKKLKLLPPSDTTNKTEIVMILKKIKTFLLDIQKNL
ncbi:MAG TPA: MerR family transcriptional regulator [Bacteroidales bacterium]|nr:MerR family transcriptional regulator [Bacteroidales bacterium]